MRQIPVRIADIKPGFSTADAKKLGITDLVGEFTTPYSPGEPRVTNIQRAAEVLDGFILGPGETFSLNAVLGPRTIEAGYVLAPQIEEGKLKDAIGGGVSQVATTLYNAAFMSGLALVAHTPHEFWISRYPRGREATVSWGGPELVFRERLGRAARDAGRGRRLRRSPCASSRASSKRRIEYGTDDPTDFKDPRERKIVNPELQPGEQHVLQQSGSAGFTISYWRKVYQGRRPRQRRDVHDPLQARGPRSSRSGRSPKPKPKPPTGSSGRSGTTHRSAGTSTAGGQDEPAPGGTDAAAPSRPRTWRRRARRRRRGSCGRWRPSRPRAAATPTSTA